MPQIVRASVAEFLGTFALVFFGAAAIIMAKRPGGHNELLAIPLAHAFILFVFVSGCGYISGGQFNPVVSLGLSAAGKQPWRRSGVFILVQLLAAVCGAALLQLLLTRDVANHPSVKLGATLGVWASFDDNRFFWNAVGLEAVMTFALMFVVLTTAVDDRGSHNKTGALAIGLTVGACIMAGGPMTGASMNPARSFGPALCGGHWNMFPVYILGPAIGAMLAAVVYRIFWEPRGMELRQ